MTWNKLDRQQKTWLFLGIVGMLLLWLLSPSAPPRPRPAPPRPRPATKAPNQPQTNRVAAAAADKAGSVGGATPAAALPAVSDPLDALLGQYVGSEMLSTARGNCVLRLELRRGGKAGEFSGFTNLVCTPTRPVLAPGQPVARGWLPEDRRKAANPTLATLSGTAENGSLRLHAVSNFGVRDARIGCEMTALTVTPGATNAIDVDWREAEEPTGLCLGAQMQMKRVAR